VRRRWPAPPAGSRQDNASTAKVAISFPKATPLASVKLSPKPGWTIAATVGKFATSITTDDGTLTEVTLRMPWGPGLGAAGPRPGLTATTGAADSETGRERLEGLDLQTVLTRRPATSADFRRVHHNHGRPTRAGVGGASFALTMTRALDHDPAPAVVRAGQHGTFGVLCRGHPDRPPTADRFLCLPTRRTDCRPPARSFSRQLELHVHATLASRAERGGTARPLTHFEPGRRDPSRLPQIASIRRPEAASTCSHNRQPPGSDGSSRPGDRGCGDRRLCRSGRGPC